MRVRLFVFTSIASIILGLHTFSFAQHMHDETMISAPETSQETPVKNKAVQVINVGNKICPVTGEKIDEKEKATYEYEGKIYNFCCSACAEEFKEDPQKYIQKINEELKAESQQGAE